MWKEIAGFLQYVLRVTAYLSLTVAPFPGYRNKNHDDYPVSLELEYPERLSRWLALARIVLNSLLVFVGFALILVMATATLIQLVTVVFYGRPDPRVHAFQVRQLSIHAHTFGFLLSLTDELAVAAPVGRVCPVNSPMSCEMPCATLSGWKEV